MLLVIYAILVLILLGISAIAILSFWRNRYHGDLTPLFVILFVILFIATAALTFVFVTPDALNL